MGASFYRKMSHFKKENIYSQTLNVTNFQSSYLEIYMLSCNPANFFFQAKISNKNSVS